MFGYLDRNKWWPLHVYIFGVMLMNMKRFNARTESTAASTVIIQVSPMMEITYTNFGLGEMPTFVHTSHFCMMDWKLQLNGEAVWLSLQCTITKLFITNVQCNACVLQVNGLFGSSVLVLHKPFSLDIKVVIDELRAVYLGVSDTFLNPWFSKKFKDCDFYIGDEVVCVCVYK